MTLLNKEITETERMYAFGLQSVPGIGNKTIQKLLERYETFEKIYKAPSKELEGALKEKQFAAFDLSRSKADFKRQYEKMKQKEIEILLWGEKDYPKNLWEIEDAPRVLFYKGKMPDEAQPTVAIIGARECSAYGSYVAGEIGRYLGQNHIGVISGMARGIDGISQAAALDAGGKSYGVLGSGVDVCYPKSNQQLYDCLLEKGGIISSYAPGVLPVAQNFPPRNRIVSGLSDAVIVVEARNKSGTLITVDMALEQGREVFVVPGRITDRLSDGCNRLLMQGAGVFLNPEDFLTQLQQICMKKGKTLCPKEASLFAGDKSKQTDDPILNFIEFTPVDIEEIFRKIGDKDWDYGKISHALMRLCMQGRVKQISPGKFVRV